MEKLYDKLIRDNIPEITRANGGEPIYRVMDEEEYWLYLLKKVAEELEEVRTAPTIVERKKELADKLEIIRAMAEFSGLTLGDIIHEADTKREKMVAFKKDFY